MVKFEQLQEWADSDKCISVMGKRLFCYPCNQFINAVENLMWNRDITRHYYIF